MKIGKHDAFENRYMGKFRALASNFGTFVEYERDMAARDIGLHLTTPRSDGSARVSPALVWFQMKGIHATTLDADTAKKQGKVSIGLSVEHLRLWRLLPDTTYLAVYVEALDQFYVADIKAIIDEEFGDTIFTDTQRSRTISVSLDSLLDEQAFRLILRNGAIDVLRRSFQGSEADAKVLLRDANFISRVASLDARKKRLLVRVTKYGSKMRTEVHFLEENADGSGKPEEVHIHWESAMPDFEIAFPYLDFRAAEPVGRDEDDWLNDDDESSEWPDIELRDGTVVRGDGVFEMGEYKLTARLNAIGQDWLRTIEFMHKADIIEVDAETKTMISVAPWHARSV
jgi:hypothetical protein